MAIIEGTGPGVIPSMQRDIMNRKPSELEAQNGAVVRMGQQVGVPARFNKAAWSSSAQCDNNQPGRIHLPTNAAHPANPEG